MNKDTDSKQFALLMNALALNCGTNISKEILRLYFETLKEFSIEQVEKAIKNCLLTWEYPRIPPLAVIVKHIQGTDENRALMIANDIIAHISGPDVMRFPDTKDPITFYLLTKRWPYHFLKYIESSKITWWIKEFCAAYQAITENPDKVAQIESKDVELLADKSLRRIK